MASAPLLSPPQPPLLIPKPDPDAPLPLPLPASAPPPPPPDLRLHSSAASPPPFPSKDKDHGSSSSNSKKRARPGEMVRVTNLTLPDHVHFRSLVRRARLTFEALRGIFHRQDCFPAARNRIDLRASSTMLSQGLWLHRDHRIVGSIPGVLVGDAFYYRAELCVVGLHSGPQAGIGYIPASLVSEGHPVATSIVSSGLYLDDEDTGDVLVYTGSGGRHRNRADHHADQTLCRGNLALHYSYHYGVEVRVIRGHPCDASPSSKVYVYDGLYRVVTSTYGPGKSGRDVCKFKLVRIPGQDHLGSNNWRAAKDLKDALDAKIRPPRYISLDLSKGKELLRVPVCNKVDDDRSPLHLEYSATPEFPAAPKTLKRHRGCHCHTACGSSRCSCERKNRGGPVYNEDGTLVRGRPVVYECGSLCGCTLSCVNRATQRGMKHRLEVFRSRETGWGVRTLDLIQPGAFICEYSADVVPANAVGSESSLIDPRRFPERWKEWGDASCVHPDYKGAQLPRFAGPAYQLDVSQKRNAACYISHSCNPNVFLQFVVRGSEDESCPHLMVFAMETIPPMRELSIDYGMD